MYIPAKLQRRGRRLLNQQCWLWGQDVRREAGNLLLEYGFERRRAPEAGAASSQYTLVLSCGRRLRLWGFGLFYGNEDEGIYLNRFEFQPRVARLGDDRWHGANELRGLPLANDTVLMQEVVRLIAGYERWVLETYGLEYRRACLCGWQKRHIASELLPAAWDDLSAMLEARPIRSVALKRSYLAQAEQMP